MDAIKTHCFVTYLSPEIVRTTLTSDFFQLVRFLQICSLIIHDDGICVVFEFEIYRRKKLDLHLMVRCGLLRMGGRSVSS